MRIPYEEYDPFQKHVHTPCVRMNTITVGSQDVPSEVLRVSHFMFKGGDVKIAPGVGQKRIYVSMARESVSRKLPQDYNMRSGRNHEGRTRDRRGPALGTRSSPENNILRDPCVLSHPGSVQRAI